MNLLSSLSSDKKNLKESFYFYFQDLLRFTLLLLIYKIHHFLQLKICFRASIKMIDKHLFSALCNDDANGNVPLGKSCNRYWQCQGGYPRLQRCPAMLVFDRRSLRLVW